MNGSQVLSVAGILSAVVSTAGGFFHSTTAIGCGAAIMLAGNVVALVTERKK